MKCNWTRVEWYSTESTDYELHRSNKGAWRITQITFDGETTRKLYQSEHKARKAWAEKQST